ncbi:MAG TPA: hypothetical protein VHD36_19045 [Pirellulales bacterium]|nr:hypothetical protein [Pirellulales bacterium]
MAFAIPLPSRRLRFSLGTLLAAIAGVALLVGWFAWQVNTVRSRRELAEEITARGGSVYTLAELQSPNDDGRSLPAFRRWLGDRPVGQIYLPPPNFSERDFRAIKRSFPEAYVWPPTPVVSK